MPRIPSPAVLLAPLLAWCPSLEAQPALAPPAAEQGGDEQGLFPPKLVHRVEAEYPEEALELGIEGGVILEIHVDESGSVTQVSVLEGPGYGLDEAARDAALRFEFEPATDEGVPVAAIIEFTYAFRAPEAGTLEPEVHPGADEAAGSAESPEAEPVLSVGPHDIEDEYTSVVTATKLGRAASDFTFTQALLAAVPVAGASELLGLAPGLAITQHSGYGKAHRIFLRGFDAVHGQDLEIRVAGIPINEPSNIHSPGYADLHFVIPELVTSLRVMEGAYDPRQGDFAVAGSAWFDLGLSTRGLLGQFSGGRFGTFEGLLAWGPRSAREETFLAGAFGRSSGFGPGRAWMSGRFMGQALWPLGGGVELRLLASSYAARFDSAGVVRLDDLRDGTMGFFDTYDENQDGLSLRHQLLVGLRGSGDAERWSASLYLVRRDLVLHHNFTGFTLEREGSAEGDRLGDLAEQQQEAWTIGALGFYRRCFVLLGLEQAIEGGLEFRHDIIDQSQERLHHVDSHPYLTEIDGAYSITDIAMYADLDLAFLSWLRVRAGLRADVLSFKVHDRLAFEGAGDRRSAMGFHVGPKATVELAVHRRVSIFLSYGNGFRSPHALGLGDGERTPFTSVHAGELGLRVALPAVLTITATGFATLVEEDVIFDHASARNILTGRTLRAGSTLLLFAKPLSWLEFVVSGSFTHAAYMETWDLLPYAPRIVVRADLHMEHAVARFLSRDLSLEGGLSARLVGPRPLPYDEWTDTLFLLDLTAGIALGEVELGVEFRNLFDSRWRDDEFVYISNFDRNAPAPDLVPQRHFTAGYPFTVMATVKVNI